MKVLAIDDDADIRFTLKEICNYAGWEVKLAEDGEQGVNLFLSYNPDVVVVDYHMPKLDGLGTIKRLRENDNRVAIVVLTVDERQEVADKLLEAGANDFALKPIKAVDLISRLKINFEITKLQQQYAKEQKEVMVDKGISSGTLSIIAGFLKKVGRGVSLEEITGEVGLAYQTVHRYLMYMDEQGLVKIDSQYGKVGRPKNKYLWDGKSD